MMNRKVNRKIAIPLLTLGLTILGACGGEPADTAAPPRASVAPAVLDLAGGSRAAETAVATITADYLRGIIEEIADDRYEGRRPGSAGDEMARDYMIARLQQAGLEPGAADGSWEQTFALVSLSTEPPPTWSFSRDGDTLELQQWDDFVVASGVQSERAGIDDAELVFVGYGIQAPEFDWDDYKGADLTGKVLLVMNNDPDWDPELFAGETRLWYGRWDYKYLSAARRGAAGVIIIHTDASAGYPFQVVQTSWTGEQFELPAGDEPRAQVEGWVTEDAARRLMDLAGQDLDTLRQAAYRRDFAPVPLGIATSLAMDVSLKSTTSANVLGLIPGSDPQLADEVVIYTAHHDHLGIGTANEAGDSIYNGALDNASGVAQTIAMARAIRSMPEMPRRSILVALVGAEEQGLLGSKYYAENPTFAPGRIAANLNFDGGNIWGYTRDLTLIGLGKSSIDEIVTLVAGAQGRVIKPDQYADRGYFYRSDQFSFAKIGVPAMYLDTGTDFVDRPSGWGHEQIDRWTAEHYHQPSDEYDDSWNFDGMLEDAELGFWVGLAIANADEMPVWTPGDEFEAARLEALAALHDE